MADKDKLNILLHSIQPGEIGDRNDEVYVDAVLKVRTTEIPRLLRMVNERVIISEVSVSGKPIDADDDPQEEQDITNVLSSVFKFVSRLGTSWRASPTGPIPEDMARASAKDFTGSKSSIRRLLEKLNA